MNTDKKEWAKRQRLAHHRALETLRADGCELSGIQLWRKLKRLEKLTHYAATCYCNGENVRVVWPLFGPRDYDFRARGSDAWEELEKVGADCVRNIFWHIPAGLFFNADARGHCIKLDSEKTSIPQGMQTDWGRDGILAADIS